MSLPRDTLLGAVAAMAEMGATTLTGGATPVPSARPDVSWGQPQIVMPDRAAAPEPPPAWRHEDRGIVVRREAGIAAVVVPPGGLPASDGRTRFALRVPVDDPLLLGEEPVAVTLGYEQSGRIGWTEARIDVRSPGAAHRFKVIGARDGGGTLNFSVPAAIVRARDGITLDVTLRLRTLNGGSATLVLRSIVLRAA